MTDTNQQTGQVAGAQPGQPPINISVTEEMKAGVYANAASASVTANELILDFGYIVPNEKPMTVKVVSRVNMSIKTAESLIQLLQGSIGDYYNKVAKVPQQPAAGVAPAGAAPAAPAAPAPAAPAAPAPGGPAIPTES
jgi:pyruvate dehydrogenase E2 component (dihydrolipoamide acetyltransferase)